MVYSKKMAILILLISFTISISQTNKNRIAVLDLEAVGVSKVESYTITDRLRSELVKTGAFIIVERSKMNAILEEQGFQMTGCTSEECAVEAGKLLGVTVVARWAGEVIHEWVLALNNGLKVGDISKAIHIYPTYSIANMELVAELRLNQVMGGLLGRIIRKLVKRT